MFPTGAVLSLAHDFPGYPRIPRGRHSPPRDRRCGCWRGLVWRHISQWFAISISFLCSSSSYSTQPLFTACLVCNKVYNPPMSPVMFSSLLFCPLSRTFGNRGAATCNNCHAASSQQVRAVKLEALRFSILHFFHSLEVAMENSLSPKMQVLLCFFSCVEKSTLSKSRCYKIICCTNQWINLLI